MEYFPESGKVKVNQILIFAHLAGNNFLLEKQNVSLSTAVVSFK
jgi:hypothetical protein